MKRILISAGPIPVRFSEDQYIVSRFSGNEAFSLATMLLIGYDITIIKWVHTELSEPVKHSSSIAVVDVNDAYSYYSYIADNQFDVYILLASVSDISPVNQIQSSYIRAEGESILFNSVPNALAIVKKNWPDSVLISGKTVSREMMDNSIDKGFSTLFESHSTAFVIENGDSRKGEKIILLPDASVHYCSWTEYINMIVRIIRLVRYESQIYSMTPVDGFLKNELQSLLNQIKDSRYGYTFGTVAYKSGGNIISTTRGKRGSYWGKAMTVDHDKLFVAGDHMTPNIPMMDLLYKKTLGHAVILHGHSMLKNEEGQEVVEIPYYFDGTTETLNAIRSIPEGTRFINVIGHGYYALFESFEKAKDWLHGR